MKVLHVSAFYWPHIGGAETYLQEISERLVGDGNRVTVVTSDAGVIEHIWARGRKRIEREREVHNGVNIQRCPVRHLPLTPYSFYLLRRSAIEISGLPFDTTPLLRTMSRYMPWVPTLERVLAAQEEPFSIVHGVNISFEYPVLMAWRYARLHNLPFVVTPFVHVGEPGSDHVIRHHTMRHQLEVLRGSRVVIVQTRIEGDRLIQLGVPEESIRQVGMGVNLEQAQGGEENRFREKHGLEDPIVTFMGAMTYDKGAIHLIQAMRELWAEGEKAELVVAGVPAGGFENFYHRFPPDIRSRVRLLGPVGGQEKKDLLAATTVLALPSRVDAFGIVYLEAWANKKPVIGALAGGVPEVVEDGQDGLLVAFGDVPALSRCIRSILENEDLAQRLGERGYEKVVRSYTWDIIYRKIKGIYEEVAG